MTKDGQLIQICRSRCSCRIMLNALAKVWVSCCCRRSEEAQNSKRSSSAYHHRVSLRTSQVQSIQWAMIDSDLTCTLTTC